MDIPWLPRFIFNSRAFQYFPRLLDTTYIKKKCLSKKQNSQKKNYFWIQPLKGNWSNSKVQKISFKDFLRPKVPYYKSCFSHLEHIKH